MLLSSEQLSATEIVAFFCLSSVGGSTEIREQGIGAIASRRRPYHVESRWSVVDARIVGRFHTIRSHCVGLAFVQNWSLRGPRAQENHSAGGGAIGDTWISRLKSAMAFVHERQKETVAIVKETLVGLGFGCHDSHS